jgi:hypothetical protein
MDAMDAGLSGASGEEPDDEPSITPAAVPAETPADGVDTARLQRPANPPPAATSNGTANGNGRPKAAQIDPRANRDWLVKSGIVNEQTDYYRKDGKVDVYHMLLSANKLGYDKITLENMDKVIQALLDNAKTKGG